MTKGIPYLRYKFHQIKKYYNFLLSLFYESDTHKTKDYLS